MSSLPKTPAEWARRKAARMTARNWIDAGLIIIVIHIGAWCAGRWL